MGPSTLKIRPDLIQAKRLKIGRKNKRGKCFQPLRATQQAPAIPVILVRHNKKAQHQAQVKAEGVAGVAVTERMVALHLAVQRAAALLRLADLMPLVNRLVLRLVAHLAGLLQLVALISALKVPPAKLLLPALLVVCPPHLMLLHLRLVLIQTVQHPVQAQHLRLVFLRA